MPLFKLFKQLQIVPFWTSFNLCGNPNFVVVVVIGVIVVVGVVEVVGAIAGVVVAIGGVSVIVVVGIIINILCFGSTGLYWSNLTLIIVDPASMSLPSHFRLSMNHPQLTTLVKCMRELCFRSHKLRSKALCCSKNQNVNQNSDIRDINRVKPYEVKPRNPMK